LTAKAIQPKAKSALLNPLGADASLIEVEDGSQGLLHVKRQTRST
jgi:hypothetical protein